MKDLKSDMPTASLDARRLPTLFVSELLNTGRYQLLVDLDQASRMQPQPTDIDHIDLARRGFFDKHSQRPNELTI